MNISELLDGKLPNSEVHSAIVEIDRKSIIGLDISIRLILRAKVSSTFIL